MGLEEARIVLSVWRNHDDATLLTALHAVRDAHAVDLEDVLLAMKWSYQFFHIPHDAANPGVVADHIAYDWHLERKSQ